MNFLIQELKRKRKKRNRKKKMFSYWIDFWTTMECCSHRNFESSSSIAILVVNQKITTLFPNHTYTHELADAFFAKDNCHFHFWSFVGTVCSCKNFKPQKEPNSWKHNIFWTIQWFKCTTRFTYFCSDTRVASKSPNLIMYILYHIKTSILRVI